MRKLFINSLLNSKPENGIFLEKMPFRKDEFCSFLKGKAVDEEEYINSKLLFTLLKMRDMSNLNDLYNAQDVILLHETFENRFQAMFEKSGFNPRKCNSASKLSGCIQREQSKVILELLTNNSIMENFEKTLTDGFSCVNTRLSFRTELLMPNLTNADYKKTNIDESFKAHKRDDLKAIYKIKFDNENTYHKRPIITKTLKLDKNKQFGYAVTKPTGCIKEHPSPSWLEFNPLLKQSIKMTRLDISLL